ncbi:MAG: amidohydrolase family protein, partial [Candidatus Atribacteria bacterium]|nr:amidohydrolase family protein [Candidatus Atribacteria bacterium]
MEKFDLLVKNGLLIDPANNKMGRFDIGLADGRVAAVDADLPSEWAQEIYDAASKLVLPGLVDVHVHLTPHIWATGFQMLARTGVTCGLECTGWVNDVVAAMEQGGSGISVAALNRLDPGVTISGSDAKKKELAEYLDRSLDDGAFGFKLLGGHLPLSPETISAAIELANAAKVYVACHCGSTRNGSNLYGLQDTMEFAGDNRILICHTNAYCRGLTHGSPATESLIALKELAAHRNVISDSNMGPYNYCEARFDGEIIRDQVTQTWLKAGGFEPNREGLLAAAKTGYM